MAIEQVHEFISVDPPKEPFFVLQVKERIVTKDTDLPEETEEPNTDWPVRRYVVAPGEITEEHPPEVQELAGVYHTPEVIAAYQASLEPEAPSVPSRVTRLQARLALIDAGLWDSVVTYFSAPERTAAELAFWEDAQNWNRMDPIVIAAGSVLGLSEELIDQLFVAAKTL